MPRRDMLATLALLGSVALGNDTVEARVPDTPVQASLKLKGYRAQDVFEDEGPEDSKGRLLAGFLGGGLGVMVSLHAKPDSPHQTSEQWCRRAVDTRGEDPEDSLKLKGKPEFFDCDGNACVEYLLEGTEKIAGHDVGMRQVNRVAFPLAAGYMFTLHISTMGAPDMEERLTRDSFLEIVRSFRVAVLRRGGWGDLPPRAIEALCEGAKRTPQEIAWAESECKTHPDDWVPSFVLGELALHRKAFQAGPKAYARAVELLRKQAKKSPEESFAHALAEEGWGLTLAAGGKAPDAFAHFRAAYDLAGDSEPLRGPLAYQLAAAYGLKSDATNAAKHLREALEKDAGLAEKARNDPAFEKVRKSAAVKALLEKAGGDSKPGGDK